MINRLQGSLIRVHEGRAELECGRVVYELLVPACDEQRLATMLGQTVEFHTLHYLESHGQGATYVPRLIGFRDRHDRAFFELFTTVKGVGNRKALRALQLPFASVAEAIARKDLDILVSLPEIGPRTAQSIVAELHGKVDRFVEVKPGAAALDAGPALPAEAAAMIADAAEVLVQLGENRSQARRLAERVMRSQDGAGSVEAIIAAALRLRE